MPAVTPFAVGGLVGTIPAGLFVGWDFATGCAIGILLMLAFWLVEREERRNRAVEGLWSVEEFGEEFWLTDGTSARLGPYDRADAWMTVRAINRLITEEEDWS